MHGAATRSQGGAPTEPRGGEPAARRRLTSSHAGFSETFRMRARQGARSRPVPSLERRGCTAEVALKQQGAPPAPHGPAPRARALGAAAAGAPAVHGPLTDTPRLAGDTRVWPGRPRLRLRVPAVTGRTRSLTAAGHRCRWLPASRASRAGKAVVVRALCPVLRVTPSPCHVLTRGGVTVA